MDKEKILKLETERNEATSVLIISMFLIGISCICIGAAPNTIGVFGIIAWGAIIMFLISLWTIIYSTLQIKTLKKTY